MTADRSRDEYAQLYPDAPALGKVRELDSIADARASIPGPVEFYSLKGAALLRPAGAAPGSSAVIAPTG